MKKFFIFIFVMVGSKVNAQDSMCVKLAARDWEYAINLLKATTEQIGKTGMPVNIADELRKGLLTFETIIEKSYMAEKKRLEALKPKPTKQK